MIIMIKNIDTVIKETDKLRKSVSDCSTDSLPQAVEAAIYIERAFYEKEIDENERADRHKTLDELISKFWTNCECKKEIPMIFD